MFMLLDVIKLSISRNSKEVFHLRLSSCPDYPFHISQPGRILKRSQHKKLNFSNSLCFFNNIVSFLPNKNSTGSETTNPGHREKAAAMDRVSFGNVVSSGFFDRNYLSCLYINPTSLGNIKLIDLERDFLDGNRVDSLFFTDTWFKDDPIVNFDKYVIYRRDRDNR